MGAGETNETMTMIGERVSWSTVGEIQAGANRMQESWSRARTHASKKNVQVGAGRGKLVKLAMRLASCRRRPAVHVVSLWRV